MPEPKVEDPGRPFRVLTLDGGGMRGLYTACLLQSLGARFSKENGRGDLDLGKGFDLIAGTSTGGILGTALAFGLPIMRIVELYRNEGPAIFTDPMPPTATKLDKARFAAWCVRNSRGAANKSEKLQEALAAFFGETTLKQLYASRGIGLCLTSVQMLKEKSRVFKTPHIPMKHLDDDYTLVSVCMATSAAPIYLPMAALDSPADKARFEVFVDGGLWANNPVLIGLIDALELCPTKRPIEILSIGTCAAPEGNVFSKSEANRGLMDWRVGAKALTVSMNAQASGSNFMATFLARHLTRIGHSVKIVRLPETSPSEEQMKYLRLDLASEKALQAFATLGANDGVEAFRLCQDPQNEDGKVISAIFLTMPETTGGR